MFMCPQRPLYVARGKILNKSIINNFLLVRIFLYVHKFISSFPSYVYAFIIPTIYMYLSKFFSESDFTHTPLGRANITHRSISQNHMKLFWIDTYAKPTEIVLRELERDVGLWYESTQYDFTGQNNSS